MKAHLVATLTLSLLLTSVATAQSGSGSNMATQPNASSTKTDTDSEQQASNAKLISINKIKQDLQGAGFKDVRIIAEAFVIQAKTKDGNPVVMTMGPHGFTAFEAVNATGTSSQAMNDDRRSSRQNVAVSRLNGMNLYDNDGNSLGDVEHVVSNNQGGQNIVIGHGGFLGMGEKQVAVPLDNVVMRKGRLVTYNLSNDQIRAMPEWKRGQQADIDNGQTVQIHEES